MDVSKLVHSPQVLAIAIERSRQVNYLNMASIAVMVLDWLLTFDLEVSLIWKAKWTVGTALYFLSRYLTFVDAALVTYHQLGFALSKATCQIVFDVVACEFIIGSVIVEFILTLRTLGVSNKNKRFTWGVSLVFAVMSIGCAVTIGLYLRFLRHHASPAPQLLGCLLGPPRYLAANYWILMVYDGYLLILMITQYMADLKSGGLDSRFMKVVYADGIFYYIYIFGLSFLNALILIKLPIEYQTLLLLLQRVMHSVLACRVVLHIRYQVVIDASWRRGFEVCSSMPEAYEIEQHLDGNEPIAESWEHSSIHR